MLKAGLTAKQAKHEQPTPYPFIYILKSMLGLDIFQIRVKVYSKRNESIFSSSSFMKPMCRIFCVYT